ncbi:MULTISPECIES: helix-turn-helix transcriptional regulator [unclassified Rhizobium]|uniref:helix-turn-helix domain-containing protein n=1 Tax=unclassified Rhizobium TaxID=2613769 RepID=UPI000CDF5492|nr:MULTISPECIES: helix-turn-helix transcriptional regulator [Rhizobium]AVA21351.1 hypothetical protein NXC24_CH01700 [Rhizobium sp. NXC24]UWU22455.1 helix-turn-helix domain-containing protein [Rhizobium tropici]
MNDDTVDPCIVAALKIFGDMLRRQRQTSRWCFREVAEKSGVTEDIISQLEYGDDVGSETDRERLCEFYGLDVGTFAKILRNERAKVAAATTETTIAETGGTNIVNLQRHREKWQRTTSHPQD